MDWRVLIVLTPVLVAASWAVFNIGAAALRQLQKTMDNMNKNT